MGRVKRFQHAWYVHGRVSVQHRHLEVGRIERDYDGLHVLALGSIIVQTEAVWGCLGSFKGK